MSNFEHLLCAKKCVRHRARVEQGLPSQGRASGPRAEQLEGLGPSTFPLSTVTPHDTRTLWEARAKKAEGRGAGQTHSRPLKATCLTCYTHDPPGSVGVCRVQEGPEGLTEHTDEQEKAVCPVSPEKFTVVWWVPSFCGNSFEMPGSSPVNGPLDGAVGCTGRLGEPAL